MLTGSSPRGERLPGRPGRGRSGGAGAGQGTRGRGRDEGGGAVTSRRGHTWQVRPGPAVCDATRQGRRDPAARAGGDAGRRDQGAVAVELAVRAGGDPPGRFGLRPRPARTPAARPAAPTTCRITRRRARPLPPAPAPGQRLAPAALLRRTRLDGCAPETPIRLSYGNSAARAVVGAIADLLGHISPAVVSC